ncbi:hypothetical protein EGT71_23035, partial [Atlantibacter subterranea]
FSCRLSPESVDNAATVFEPAGSARRSRTPERSESVSEEAAFLLQGIFYLRPDPAFFTCFMWQLCPAFLRCYILSQYTLR